MRRSAAALCLGLVVLVGAGQPPSGPPTWSAPELAGLWTAHRQFGPEVRGPLELLRQADGWWAEIGGFSVPASVAGDTVRFSLPGERGAFSGRFVSGEAGRPVLHGHWIQPRTARSLARMATPATLEPAGEGRWAGTVTPLADELHLYLAVRQREDGSLTAFLRNPEANIGRFYPIDRIVVDGEAVEFRDAEGQTLLDARYDPDFDRLSVYFPWNGGTYDFERTDRWSRFYPRPLDDPAYEYRRPSLDGDWDVARPEDVGMETGPLVEMVRMIATTPIDAIDAPCIHGVLVARHGKLVLEEYFHGYTRNELHGTRSASKSLTTTLVGIAVHEGTLTLDAPVYETMYDGAPPGDVSARAHRMTLEDLITMTPGLACDDSDPDSPGNEDRMQSQEEQPDWLRYTLELPMAHEPGEHAAYCSASQNLAGGVLSRLSGEWLPDYYRDHFAAPMGAEPYAMNLAPDGAGYGGGGLYVRPRDFLKLGQLYLNDGTWRGRRLLDSGWAATATRAHYQIRDEGYGYGWWVFSYPWRGRELPALYAGGNGGQYVIVVPELDLVVAIFGGNYNQHVMHVSKYEYVRDYVVVAVQPG